MTPDEIYESFLWDPSYSNEEYEARIAVGINEAKKFKYLYPFIQPFIPEERSKSIWEPCAQVIAQRADEELEPYLSLLFEWLQDMNWPGAYIIFDRLAEMPFSLLEKPYAYCRQRAEKENDTLWLMALNDLKKRISKE